MKKETMGMVIASRRKELGMTQAGVAEKMGVTDKAVSKWERDLSYPDVDSIPKLAEVLDMSVDELMQIKTESAEEEKKSPVQEMLDLIPKTVAIGMGGAVTVLSIMGKIDVQTGMTLLGIGLACVGIALFDRD